MGGDGWNSLCTCDYFGTELHSIYIIIIIIIIIITLVVVPLESQTLPQSVDSDSTLLS